MCSLEAPGSFLLCGPMLCLGFGNLKLDAALAKGFWEEPFCSGWIPVSLSGLLEVKVDVAVYSNLGSLDLSPAFKTCAYDLVSAEALEVPAAENDVLEDVIKGLFEISDPDDLNKDPDCAEYEGGLEIGGTDEKGFTLSCGFRSFEESASSWKGFLVLAPVLNFAP